MLNKRPILLILLFCFLICLTACAESAYRPTPERIEPNIGCGSQPIPVDITGNHFVAIISEDLAKKKKRPEVDKLFRVILRHIESGEERGLINIDFYDHTWFQAVVPAGLRRGWHDLIVTNPDGESGTLPRAYYVINICSIEPITGCIGDPVSVIGTDFGPDTGAVSFNGTSATVTSWGNTSIVVSAPGGNFSNVTITPTDTGPSSLADTYSYDNQPPTGLAASPAGGIYCATAVSLTVSEGTIYYTINGTEPTAGSTAYAGPIDIGVDTTLKFMAVDICGNRTATVTEIYSIDLQAPTTLVASLAGGSYCPTTVSLGASDGTIYYTVDGSGPTTGSLVYAGPVNLNVDTTLKFIAVDVCGNPSTTVTAVYDIYTDVPTGLAASPAGGSYCATTVSLSVSAGTIYYTMDGSDPTTGSPVYGAPININVDTTLKFIAVEGVCGNQSAIVTEVYDIDTVAAVAITSPVDGVSIFAGDITVTGTADTDITTVTVTTDQGHNVSSGVDLTGNWSVVLAGITVPSIAITAQGTDGCGNIGSDGTINAVIISAKITITKLVENLTRKTGPASNVDAITGDRINYIVNIKNEGNEDATLADAGFNDIVPIDLLCDGPVTVFGALAGALHCDVPTGDIVIDVPIIIPGPSTVVINYRATVE